MKSTRTYVPVIMAVEDRNKNIDAISEIITPLVCVANKPLILFPFEFLIRNSFDEVIVVTAAAWERELREIVDDYVNFTVKETLKVHYVSIDDTKPTVGSMDCLKKGISLENIIKDRDVLVMSYDLICDVNFSILDELHRKNDSSLTILLSQKPSLQNIPLPVPKKYKKQEREITVFSEGQLVHISTESSMDGFLTLKPSLLKNACNFDVHSDLVDCHFYMLSNRCLPCLTDQKFVSLQKDFVPWLVNDWNDESVIESVSSDHKKTFKSCHKELHSTDNRTLRRLVCQAHIHTDTQMCMRVNTVATLCAANFILSKQAENNHHVKGVSSDSSVGKGVEMYGKVNIKASVVGDKCSLGSNCKISNSIVMSHAIIQQNVTLENTIVCGSARVAEGSMLKECIVSHGQSVTSGNYVNKEIMPNERLIPV